MTAGRRSSGGWVSDRLKLPPQLYRGDQLGGLCTECEGPLPAALAGVVTMHPTCDPDFPPMRAALERELKRRAANLPKPDNDPVE